MGAEEYGPAALHEFQQPVLELSLDEGVQVKEGLVHEQHPGFVEHGCRDGGLFFQALGQAHAQGGAPVLKPEELYPLIHPAVVVQSPDGSHKVQVLFDAREAGRELAA